MHSTLKPHFNFSHYIGVHVRTLQVKDFMYMLNLDRFLPNIFRVDSHDKPYSTLDQDILTKYI